MFLRSIRYKIILLYTLILAVVLSLFSVMVYANLRKTLYNDFNNLLRVKAEGVEDSIETYWEIEKQEGLRQGASSAVFSKVNNLNFVKIAQRWVKEELDDPELLGIVVNIFNSGGEKIASSRGNPGITSMSRDNFDAALKGRSRFDNALFWETPSGKPVLMRQFTVPVIENKKLAYVVQVASPETSFRNALNKLRFVFFLLLPLAVLFSSIAGFFLADLIIKPINRIVSTMRRITAQNLRLRIDIPDTEDEIGRLADTFNAMLAKLDASFTSQKQLVQDISHELRTPLTIMRGEMEVALKKSRSREEYTAVLESSLEEIAHLSVIVEDLLVLSRFDNQDAGLEIEPVPLSGFLADIVSDMRIISGAKKISITFRSAAEPVVRADKYQLRRAFLNVIGNAVKYTPEGGEIVVELQKSPAGAVVKVVDNGIGIAGDNLPFVFDRFFRVDKSRSSEGFGLGLSITKSIIEAHKGSVAIDSLPGKGTAVTVELPY